MNLASVGYFSRTHGTKGHLVLKTEVEFEEDQIKVVFVAMSGSKAPYFIDEIKMAGKDLVFHLEGIEGPEQAKVLLNKEVFAEESLLIAQEGSSWDGYELHEESRGLIGTVLFVSENGAQELLHLNYQGKEVILPLVPEFVIKVDEEGRKIHYRAPEGLIDVYLEAE